MSVEELNAFMAQSPFNAWLGCRIRDRHEATGQMEVTLPNRPEIRRDSGGFAHGGVVAALIDVAAHACLHAITKHGMPTIDLKVDYLTPAEMPLTARATPRRAGRTIGFVDVEITDARGQLAAVGRAILLTRPPTG